MWRRALAVCGLVLTSLVVPSADAVRPEPTTVAAPLEVARDVFTGHRPDAMRQARRVQAPYPMSRTFALHSRPGSDRTIYLDFDGYRLSIDSTWADAGLPALRYPGWSLDKDSARFSVAEKSAIQVVWERVAEDYAPFDVDVTTEQPTLAQLTRTDAADTTYGGVVAFTDSSVAQAASATCSGSKHCSGTAYIGVFGRVEQPMETQPAWVFTRKYDDIRSLAETASHEMGHQFGLHHDGVKGGVKGGSDYYHGHGIWAPIMGSAFRPLSQWSDGEYARANNTEDDVAIIARSAPLIPDEAGPSILTASSVLPTPARPAVINSRQDVDMYALGVCTKTLRVSVRPAAASPDLDLRARIVDPLGDLLGVADPPSGEKGGEATGLGAVLSLLGSSRPRWVAVSGVGQGDPASTGYSDYGSLGRYTLRATCS